ncbi:MAG: N-acetylglucosamine-6-phosphate deacetylase [Bacillota bacterium]
MKMHVSGGTLVTPNHVLKEHDIIIEQDKILAILPSQPKSKEYSIDARGMWVVPGFIDLHIHGSAGFDTMDATNEAIHGLANFLVKHGVTSYLPTTIAASAERIREVLANIRHCPQPEEGARHLGLHLEGPYLSSRYRGAQPFRHIRPVDPDEYRYWLVGGFPVFMVTLAPEVDGIDGFLKAGTDAGIIFAVGHSEASYEQVLAAAELGLSQASHLFNGMPPFHHREPGVVGAVLMDHRIVPQVIVDGVHLHPAALKLVVKAKGIDKTILITDATRGAGLKDGDYTLGDQAITVQNGIARTREGGLAGSTLTMDVAIKNMMEYTGLSLPEAVTMATLTPAVSIGMCGKKGILASGADADLVLLDHDCRVRMTMVMGRVVYNDM